jgi:hypothetical protein
MTASTEKSTSVPRGPTFTVAGPDIGVRILSGRDALAVFLRDLDVALTVARALEGEQRVVVLSNPRRIVRLTIPGDETATYEGIAAAYEDRQPLEARLDAIEERLALIERRLGLRERTSG